eukprot:11054246-Alexandrium_andersonii.AAC.1
MCSTPLLQAAPDHQQQTTRTSKASQGADPGSVKRCSAKSGCWKAPKSAGRRREAPEAASGILPES